HDDGNPLTVPLADLPGLIEPSGFGSVDGRGGPAGRWHGPDDRLGPIGHRHLGAGDPPNGGWLGLSCGGIGVLELFELVVLDQTEVLQRLLPDPSHAPSPQRSPPQPKPASPALLPESGEPPRGRGPNRAVP